MDLPLCVVRHVGVLVGLESPTEGVGVDANEWAEVPCPGAVIVGDSKLVAPSR